jgi:hypothetical protein
MYILAIFHSNWNLAGRGGGRGGGHAHKCDAPQARRSKQPAVPSGRPAATAACSAPAPPPPTPLVLSPGPGRPAPGGCRLGSHRGAPGPCSAAGRLVTRPDRDPVAHPGEGRRRDAIGRMLQIHSLLGRERCPRWLNPSSELNPFSGLLKPCPGFNPS